MSDSEFHHFARCVLSWPSGFNVNPYGNVEMAGIAALNPPYDPLTRRCHHRPAMSNYRRLQIAGGCYFFTVNLLERAPNDLLVRHIDVLRESVHEAR